MQQKGLQNILRVRDICKAENLSKLQEDKDRKRKADAKRQTKEILDCAVSCLGVKTENGSRQQTEKQTAVSVHKKVVDWITDVAGQYLTQNISSQNENVIREQHQMTWAKRIDAPNQIGNCQPKYSQQRQQAVRQIDSK